MYLNGNRLRLVKEFIDELKEEHRAPSELKTTIRQRFARNIQILRSFLECGPKYVNYIRLNHPRKVPEATRMNDFLQLMTRLFLEIWYTNEDFTNEHFVAMIGKNKSFRY